MSTRCSLSMMNRLGYESFGFMFQIVFVPEEQINVQGNEGYQYVSGFMICQKHVEEVRNAYESESHVVKEEHHYDMM